MAPFVTRASSKGDDGEMQLLVELETLNQALEHTRSRSLSSHAASPRHESEHKFPFKRPVQPRPCFKVTFRSTSTSWDRLGREKYPNSIKQPVQQRPISVPGVAASTHAERRESAKPHQAESFKESKHPKDGCPLQKTKDSVPHTEIKRISKKGSKLDQMLQRKSIWNWRLLRAFSHTISGLRSRSSVVFSLRICRIESLPVSMNGRRLTVLWTCKQHCLQTMPCKVVGGVASFGESLHCQCPITSSPCSSNVARPDHEPSTLSVMAADLDESELSKHHVNLSCFLPTKDPSGALLLDNSDEVRFKLSGAVKGGILIVKVHHRPVQNRLLKANENNRQSPLKKILYLPKGIPILQGATFAKSNVKSSTGLADPDAAVRRCHSTSCLGTKDWDATQGSKKWDTAQDSRTSCDVCDDDFSDSFEFKIPLKSNQSVDFSFSCACSSTISDDSLCDKKNTYSTHTKHPYDNFTLKEVDSLQPHGPPEKSMLQKLCCAESQRCAGSLSVEVARCLTHPTMAPDDDLDSIAEEFLNMLGMGFDAEHHNSENDSESPREKLLKQSEEDIISVSME